MHIHILGICGTFMGGIALLAKAAGHRVSGCDANVYPPMSSQLAEQGIELTDGYQIDQISLNPDYFVVGNVVSRGNPLLEEILDRNLPYVSGPQWLADNILPRRWVLGVAGTHGKTTTTSMLAWILERAGLDPSFLIGGVPLGFAASARLTESPFFVIEADEYDTAFCDKRSKFIHYHLRTAVLNNLEFDHADIFDDLAAIERQFHHLVRTVPGSGLIVVNGGEASLRRVLDKGCWSGVERFATPDGWTAGEPNALGEFEVLSAGLTVGRTRLELPGAHNRANALAALLAARHVGVPLSVGLDAIASFKGVRRRLELLGVVRGISVYDDFAHHPTAIAATLAGLRSLVGCQRIIAVLEPRSNTMKLGTMKSLLPGSLADANRVYCYSNGLCWNASEVLAPIANKTSVVADFDELIRTLARDARDGDHVVIMSNGGFGGIHARLLAALRTHI